MRHTLIAEGAPHDSNGERTLLFATAGRSGRAKCSCGELSPDLPSGRQRKQWHQDHKEAVKGRDPETKRPRP